MVTECLSYGQSWGSKWAKEASVCPVLIQAMAKGLEKRLADNLSMSWIETQVAL